MSTFFRQLFWRNFIYFLMTGCYAAITNIQTILHTPTGLHHQPNRFISGLEQARIIQRIAVHHNQVGHLAGFQCPQPVGNPQQSGIGVRGCHNGFHGGEAFGLNTQFAPLKVLIGADDIRSRGDVDPRLPCHPKRLFACQRHPAQFFFGIRRQSPPVLRWPEHRKR